MRTKRAANSGTRGTEGDDFRAARIEKSGPVWYIVLTVSKRFGRKRMKKLLGFLWDFLQIAGLAVWFLGFGGFVCWWLLWHRPCGFWGYFIGTSLLIVLAVMIRIVAKALLSDRLSCRERGKKRPEDASAPQEAAEMPSSPAPNQTSAPSSDKENVSAGAAETGREKRHVSWFGYLILLHLLLVFAGFRVGELEERKNYRISLQLYESGVKAYDAGDCEAAAECFEKSAEKGYSRAQYRIGKCYLDGVGVRKDAAAALEWFRLAAEQGNAEARAALESWKSGRGRDAVSE